MVDDFRYASQWVFDEIESKRDYLKYLEAKFSVVKKLNVKVIAEVGMYNKKHCIILDNIRNGVSEKVTFLVETKNGVILRADMCMIPSPNSVEMLGIIPK